MEDYLDSLAGKQGQYSQAIRETQVAFTEALEPTLVQMTEMKKGLIKLLGNLISNNKAATAGTTAFITTALAAIVAVGALTTAKTAYAKATGVATLSTKAFTTALLSNPITGIVIALASFVSILTTVTTASKEQATAQEKLNEVTERYKEIKEGIYGFSEKEIQQIEQDKIKIEEQIQALQKKLDKEKELQDFQKEMNKYAFGGEEEDLQKYTQMRKQLNGVYKDANDANKAYENWLKTNTSFGNSLDELNERLRDNNKQIEKSNVVKNISKAFETEKIKKQQQEAAQLKRNVQELQNYLSVLKNADKSSNEYQKAVETITKAYPEAVSEGGVLINVLEGIIGAQQLQADEAWNASQTSIQGHINNINMAIQDEGIQRQVAQSMGIAYDESFRPKLEAILALLQMIGGYQPSEVPNVKPISISKPKSAGSKSYQNKALDNYKKDIEYKKSLDQISMQQEISMYEIALRKYAKTTDEKRELRTKIYELNKELAQKEKEILKQQTEDYEAYIQEQKNLRGASYDVTEQTRDYNKIIQMHRNYLNEIMQDERLSLEERKEIYREELQTIRDYEQQKRDLRVEAIDNTVSHLTNAITKQLEEMQEKDKEFIDKQIEEIERLKGIRIDAINAEYDAKIEAIEKELEALDKAEQQKSRDEEDAEHEKKKKRLEELVAYEHNAVTKANYQKELDKLLAEYQKTLDKRALEDKKEALNEQKDLLQKEQDDKTQAIEDEAEKQKEAYNKQLEDLENYYEKQIEMAQEKAESMLLNVEQNQDKILELLQKYGDKYEITGQSLGEKLAQGINEALANKLENIIQRIQNTIDAGIENQLAKIAGSVYKYEAGAGKPQMANKTVNVYQTNNIEQNPELPSETYRKLRNVSEKLAEEFAGM